MNSRAAMVVSLTVLILASGSLAYAESPINIGSRRELFVDDYLISNATGSSFGFIRQRRERSS